MIVITRGSGVWITMLILLGFGFCGCDQGGARQESVVGTWVGEMPQTEWGPMAYELILDTTGGARLVVTDIDDREVIIHEQQDAYTVSNQQITFNDLFGGGTLQVDFEGGQLVLSTNGSELYRMKRK